MTVIFLVLTVSGNCPGIVFAQSAVREKLEELDSMIGEGLKTKTKEVAPVIAGKVTVEYTGANNRDPLELPMELRRPAEKTIGKKIELGKGSSEEIIELPPMTVQGMVWGGSQPQAIIDHKVLQEGDIIKEATIVDIDKTGVTFVYQDEKFILRPVMDIPKVP